MTTREEHLKWCKTRALEYLESGDIHNAIASMMSDLGKHPETQNHPAKGLGVQLQMLPGGLDYDGAKKYIEGFN